MAACLVCIALGWLGSARARGPYGIYELAARSEVVASAEMTGATSFADGRFVVYRLTVSGFLKGGAPRSEIALVQDRGPEKHRPELLSKGERFLLFATRLPRYSLYQKSLPPGQYWQWAEPYPTARRVNQLSEKEVARVVKGYLSIPESDRKAAVAFVFRQLASSLDWLRRDSIARLAAEMDLESVLGEAAVASARKYITDERLPADERGRLVALIEERKLDLFAPALKELLQHQSGIAGDALKALGSLGQAPPLAGLLGYSRSEQTRLRAGAAFALGREGSKEALRRLGEMAIDDPDQAVRLASAEALGYSKQATEELERVLAGPDKEVKAKAAESLARIGSDEAVEVLGRRLYREDNDAAAAAVFALARLKSPAAVNALNEALRSSKNEHVRKLIMTLVPGGRH